jgi:amidohydrolase
MAIATSESVRETVRQLTPELIALRHEFHQHPEIRFEEKWTSDRIARFLRENEIEHQRGYAKGTGIVATVRGEGDRAVALRADMDALEIHEETGLPYASTIPNRMHACGHDGHTSILCGVAKTLKRHERALKGTVKLVFQPAEEQAGGGKYMVNEGALDGAQGVFGLHCWPTIPVGKVGFKSGSAMASGDFFFITVRGKGCHGADPGAGVDPLIVASYITVALQSIVSREIDPWHPAVVTVARIDGGFASNVIPETAKIDGTFRALDARTRSKLFEAIERIATLTAKAHRAEAEIAWGNDPYPPLVNDDAMLAFSRDVTRETFGEASVLDLKHPTMGAEDFAFYLEKVPGAFLFLGNNPSATEPYPPLHSPHFNFNDDALPIGVEMMANVALRFLERR